MVITNVCETCGKEFEVDRPNKAKKRRFCSLKCYGSTRQKREIATCAVCGTEFERGGHFVKGSGRKVAGQTLCSNECARRARYRHGRLCKELAPTEAAYLAGVWDSDGAFILHGRYDGSDTVAFRCAIGVTKAAIIEWLVEKAGIGTRYFHRTANPKHADRYDWWVNGDGAESFARQLLPYLVLKRPQAELGIEFQERLRDPALKADRIWQQEYRERMRDMNKRGV